MYVCDCNNKLFGFELYVQMDICFRFVTITILKTCTKKVVYQILYASLDSFELPLLNLIGAMSFQLFV